MPTPEVPRDRYSRPLIVPPGGGKPVPYYRASSFADVLDDRHFLEKWLLRLAVKGVATRPDLRLAAASTPLEAKWRLDRIAQDAIDAAGGSQASSIGSSLHELTERLDRGEKLTDVPAEYMADLDAYQVATAAFDHAHIEQFLVCDELQIAGTPDRLMYESDLIDAGAKLVVGDLKSGKHSAYLGKHNAQLAIYAHSQLYDPATGARTPLNIEQAYGYIFHMPAGEGHCEVYELDLEAGWETVLLAARVREWRKGKQTAKPFTTTTEGAA